MRLGCLYVESEGEMQKVGNRADSFSGFPTLTVTLVARLQEIKSTLTPLQTLLANLRDKT